MSIEKWKATLVRIDREWQILVEAARKCKDGVNDLIWVYCGPVTIPGKQCVKAPLHESLTCRSKFDGHSYTITVSRTPTKIAIRAHLNEVIGSRPLLHIEMRRIPGDQRPVESIWTEGNTCAENAVAALLTMPAHSASKIR